MKTLSMSQRFGIFGFGMYPIALELSVEATYPMDESAGTAIIFLSGNLHQAILLELLAVTF